VIQLDLDVRDIRQRRARGDQPCNGGAVNDGCVGKNKVIRCLGLNRVCGTGLLRPRPKLAVWAAGTEGKRAAPAGVVNDIAVITRANVKIARNLL
jgi:hypothetical protein